MNNFETEKQRVYNNYAETKSTEVKLRLKPAVFFINYVKKTVRCGNFFLSATVGVSLIVILDQFCIIF